MIIGIASADYVRSDMNETGIDQWGGSGWARYGQYIPALEAAGHTVAVGTLWKHDKECAIELAGGTMVLPDIIFSQRLMHKGLDDAYKLARSAGQIVVCDVDDWYWGLSPNNDAFLSTHPKVNPAENRDHYKSSLFAASYLTVSTQYLFNRITDWQVHRQHPSQLIFLQKNYVDVSRFTPVQVTDTNVPEVGWVGSTAHRSGDIETLKGILPSMVRAKHIQLVHGGDWPSSPSFASALGLEPEDVRTITRVGHADYPKLLDFEVGIVPLHNTPFNQAKSDIKGLEYAASGIPFVAQNLDSYKELGKSWAASQVIRVAKTGYDWRKYLESLRDPEVRQFSARRARGWADQRDIRHGAAMMLSHIDYISHG